MENHIYRLSMGSWKNLFIRNDIFYLSFNYIRTPEQFELEIQSPRFLNVIESYPLANIIKVAFQEGSKYVRFSYVDKKDKIRRTSIRFFDEENVKIFKQYINSTLELNKSITIGKSLKSVAPNYYFLFLFIAISVYFFISKSLSPTTKEIVLIVIGISGCLYSIIKKSTQKVKITTFSKIEQGSKVPVAKATPLITRN